MPFEFKKEIGVKINLMIAFQVDGERMKCGGVLINKVMLSNNSVNQLKTKKTRAPSTST